jgi:hypothetical protein
MRFKADGDTIASIAIMAEGAAEEDEPKASKK